jgi:hypothetical protein
MKELLEHYGFKYNPKNKMYSKGKDSAEIWKDLSFVTVNIKGTRRTLSSLEQLKHFLKTKYPSIEAN